MVDVQQGDGLVLDTPQGKTVVVDGGDNKLFARHLAARYLHRPSSAPAAAAAELLPPELVELFRGDAPGSAAPPFIDAFERTNFGIIHIRTDGERVLVFTHSGQRGLNEAYRFRVAAQHQVVRRSRKRSEPAEVASRAAPPGVLAPRSALMPDSHSVVGGQQSDGATLAQGCRAPCS